MSTLSCLALWSSYIESAAARWGFRAFKKALVSPYSAKVNNRESSSRGPTQSQVWPSVRGGEVVEREAGPRAPAEKPFQRSGHPVRMEAAGARLGRRVVPDGSSAENSL